MQQNTSIHYLMLLQAIVNHFVVLSLDQLSMYKVVLNCYEIMLLNFNFLKFL